MADGGAGQGGSLASQVCHSPLHLLAFGLGSGLAPWAPGTFGTLVGIPLFWALSDLPLADYLGLTLLLTLFGIWLCGRTAHALGVHDHPGIVWDEIVGYLVTMTGLPADAGWMLAGFVAFRFFDIVKPWPIHHIDDHLGDGLGIMLDDLIAGLFAAILLQVAAYLIP